MKFSKPSVRQIDIPKNIEDYICDSDIPDIWYRANNKIYKNTDNCVNDLRRFALMCFYDFLKKIKKSKKRICSNVLDIKETENNILEDNSDMPLEAPKHDSEEGKPDLGLIPYDLINEMLLPAYEEGLQEYYRDSWRLGFPVLKMCAALLRHLFAFMFKHENYDPVAKEKYNIKKHHLGAVMFCCISIYNSIKINPDKFDDRIRLPKGKSERL